MKEIENTLKQNKTETSRKETEASKFVNEFFKNLNQIINQDNKELVLDLCFLSFDLLIMANYILEPFQINQSTNINSSQSNINSNIKPSSPSIISAIQRENQAGICFSFEPILNEQIIDYFNKNVISLRIKKLLDKTLELIKINENKKEICGKCEAFVISNSQKINQNQWKCFICANTNQIKFRNIDFRNDSMAIEFIKNLNTLEKPAIKNTNNNDCKIIVFFF